MNLTWKFYLVELVILTIVTDIILAVFIVVLTMIVAQLLRKW